MSFALFLLSRSLWSSLVLSHGVVQAFTKFFNLFQLQPKTTDKKEEEKKVV